MFRRGKFKPTIKPSLSRSDARTPIRSSTSSASNSIGTVVEGLIKPKAVEPGSASSSAKEVSSNATVEKLAQDEPAEGEERINGDSLRIPESQSKAQHAGTTAKTDRCMVQNISDNSYTELSSTTMEQTKNDLEFDITVDIEEQSNLPFSEHKTPILDSSTRKEDENNDLNVSKQDVNVTFTRATENKISEELKSPQEEDTAPTDMHSRTSEPLKNNIQLEESGTKVDAIAKDNGHSYKEIEISAALLHLCKCDNDVEDSVEGRADRDIEDSSVEAKDIGSSVVSNQNEAAKRLVKDNSSKGKRGKKSQTDKNDKGTKAKVKNPKKKQKEGRKTDKDTTEAGENKHGSLKTSNKTVEPGKKRKGSSDGSGINSKEKDNKKGGTKRKREPKDEKIKEKPSVAPRKPRIYGPIDESKMTIGDMVYYEKEKPKITNHRSKKGGVKEDLKSHEAEEPTLSLEPIEKVMEDELESKSLCTEENGDEVLAPQVMLADDGSMIVKESSLYIKQTTSKQELSETVYEDEHSNFNPYFRKRCSVRNKWSVSKTLKFYRALSQVGTDFTLMLNIFPQETRKRLKMKFKWEEKINGDLVDRALANRLPLNLGDLLGLEKKSDEENEDT